METGYREMPRLFQMRITSFELHVTSSKAVAFEGMPDLRGVANWQNLLRRLIYIVRLDRIQISKSQYRHLRRFSSDTFCSVYEYN